MIAIDMSGMKINKLTVIKRVESNGIASKQFWECICECGKKVEIRHDRLNRRKVQSCGCVRAEKARTHASKLNYISDPKKYILDRIIVNKKTECWEWTGTLFKNGYARSGLRRYTQRANRLSFQLFNGDIEEGKIICHKCDNPLCVNPKHLFQGSYQDNVDDMISKDRSPRGIKHHNARLTENNIVYIRKSKLPISFLANKFSVSKCTINDIKKRRSWKHIV